MFCKGCGTELADDALFCPNCGKGITASDKPKKKPYALMGIIGGVVCLTAGGFFFLRKPETDVKTTEAPPLTESVGAVTEPPQESVPEVEKTANPLNAGTYANELDRITIAQDVEGGYSFNLTGYDESGDFLLLSGNIDNNNGEYLAVISDDDESGNFVDKRFSIAPDGDSVVISSDDDALLFLCAQYQYFSEVDALEADASDFDGEVTNGTDDGGGMYADSATGYVEGTKFWNATSIEIPYMNISIPQEVSQLDMDFDLFLEQRNYSIVQDKTDDKYLSSDFDYENILSDGVKIYYLYSPSSNVDVGVKDNKIVIYNEYISTPINSKPITLREILPLDKLPAPYTCFYEYDFFDTTTLIWKYEDGYFLIRTIDSHENIMRGIATVGMVQFVKDIRYSGLYSDGIPLTLH